MNRPRPNTGPLIDRADFGSASEPDAPEARAGLNAGDDYGFVNGNFCAGGIYIGSRREAILLAEELLDWAMLNRTPSDPYRQYVPPQLAGAKFKTAGGLVEIPGDPAPEPEKPRKARKRRRKRP